MLASSGGAFQWLNAVPWVLSALALAFSIVNYLRTNSLARRLRKDAIARDEFNSRIRTPIESALNDMMVELPKLKSLTRSMKGLDQLKTEIDCHAQAITEKAEKLLEALESADRVPWASGTDWAASAGADWDRFLQFIASACGPETPHDQMVAAVSNAAKAITDLNRSLRRRIEQEIERHIARQ